MENRSDIIKGDLVGPNLAGKNLTITQGTVKQGLKKYLDKEVIQEKLAHVPPGKDRMLIECLWMSGIRIGEALSLEKRHLDFQNYTALIRWLKSRKYYERNIPLHPKLRDALYWYCGQLRQEDRLFQISRQRAFQITKKWMGCSPHQLRHSFAVNWLRQGGDLFVLHLILGHSNIKTTREYLKIVPVDQGKELAKIQFD